MQVEVGSQLSERSPPRHDAGSSRSVVTKEPVFKLSRVLIDAFDVFEQPLPACSAASASAMLQQPVEGLRRLAQLNVEVKQSQPTGVGAGRGTWPRIWHKNFLLLYSRTGSSTACSQVLHSLPFLASTVHFQAVRSYYESCMRYLALSCRCAALRLAS